MTRLLVFSRNEISRNGLAAVLTEKVDVQIVSCVESVEEAISDISFKAPQVVLLDDNSDDRLLEAASSQNVGMVAFIANADDDEVRRSLGRGVRGFVFKSSSVSLLISAITAVADGVVWLDPSIGRRILAGLRQAGDGVANNPQVMLSHRELEVLSLLTNGLSNRDIARQLVVSAETIKTHVRHIMEKIQARSRTEAAIRAIELGLIQNSDLARLSVAN